MVTKVRTIEVAPGSELARLLDDPAGLPVEFVKDGVRYRLEQTTANEEDGADAAEVISDERIGWEGYDPERVRRVLDEMAGTLTDEEADRWIENIYRWRKEGSRPPDRP